MVSAYSLIARSSSCVNHVRATNLVVMRFCVHEILGLSEFEDTSTQTTPLEEPVRHSCVYLPSITVSLIP